MREEVIAVIGLGYVGLPVALAFARRYARVLGYDSNPRRIEALRSGDDWTREVDREDLLQSRLILLDQPSELATASLFVVTVPTPIDGGRRPDLGPLLSACETIGKAIHPGAVVVFESTVYPGVTEEICGPAIARVSGLQQGRDFKLAYSPERINPGDREHTLERIVKVVAGEDPETLERVAAAYGAIVPAGIHRAPGIKVAEAAKVIENTQRDLNIALMNELAIIFQRLGIRTKDVLDASGTKWNFLPFSPGLVGGHCIGVDPYYLTAKAEEVGYYPQVILAGRRINDGMGQFIADQLIRLLIQGDRPVRSARIGILGLTFKENVPDLRNSRVPDIIRGLQQFGVEPLVHDALADPEEAKAEYGIELCRFDEMRGLDGVVLAVAHTAYRADPEAMFDMLAPGGVLMDVKSALAPDRVPAAIRYWSL